MRAFLAVAALVAANAFAQIGGPVIGQASTITPPSVTSPIITASTKFLAADGTACSAPSYAFTSATTTGWVNAATVLTLCQGGTGRWQFDSGGNLTAQGNQNISLGGTSQISANTIHPTGVNTKFLVSGSGANAVQLSTSQTTPPTCSTNCGTSPTVVGTDTFMKVTMGATGAPASGFVVTFNGTWAAAPPCIVQSGLSTMVVGKMPIAVQTAPTTITVTTNGTAPGNADVYYVQCGGVQ